MKKWFRIMASLSGLSLTFLLLFVAGGAQSQVVNQSVSNQVHLQVTSSGVDPTQNQGETPRSPIQPPCVYLDDYSLDMSNVAFDATLQLVDEDGEVVYMTFVPQGTPSVTLPGSLSGDYELQLLWGNWCFYGWINL